MSNSEVTSGLSAESASAAETPLNEETMARFRQSFLRLEGEIAGVAESDLITINLDVQSAVTTVVGALPELKAIRPALAQLPFFDLARFDKLEDYTFALGHAHAVFRAASGPGDDVSLLAAEALEVRDLLHTDAIALAKRRLLDEGRVAQLRSGTGYKSIAFDVLGLVALLREHWTRIENKTAIEATELDAAERLSDRLVTALGLREQGPAALSQAMATRQRAFALFWRAYDEARRAVQFLRWHQGDGDTIAPSLLAGRGGRRSSESRPDQPSVAPPAQPGAPTPPIGSVPATGFGSATGVGLPGSNPFSAQ